MGGLNIKGLPKENMPRVGDVMVMKGEKSIGRVKEFTAQVQILNHPGELKVGKETGNQKAESPSALKANEMAQVAFEPQQRFVVDTFKSCEGLGRIAILEGNSVVMLGKITKCTIAEEKGK